MKSKKASQVKRIQKKSRQAKNGHDEGMSAKNQSSSTPFPPREWFEHFRRELSPSGDSRPIEAILAIRAVAHSIETKLSEWITPSGLSLGQFNILISLWGAEEQTRTMSDVCRALVASPANATKLVTQLEEDGLLTREPDPRDRRGVIVKLTAKGKKRMQAVAPAQIARVESAMNETPGWVCEALIEFLNQIQESFETTHKLNQFDSEKSQ